MHIAFHCGIQKYVVAQNKPIHALESGRKLSRPTIVFITAKKAVVSGRQNLFRRLLFLQFQGCAAVWGDLIIY